MQNNSLCAFVLTVALFVRRDATECGTILCLQPYGAFEVKVAVAGGTPKGKQDLRLLGGHPFLDII